MSQSGQIGIYIHWPFCLSKCPYCDFNVHIAGEGGVDHARWLSAYLRSLSHYAQRLSGRVVRSVFFGGGTPSLMLPENVAAILDAVHELWPCVNDMEVTLEANPTSIEAGRFEAFARAGVTRVSVGVQALNNRDLSFLGRTHDKAQALEALRIARGSFGRFSFDLIYARPDQSLDEWREELEGALELSGGHLSLYQLTVERNTPFYFTREQGGFSLPEEDLAADFYGLTQDIMTRAGMPAYEVSNHALEGHESMHNLIYWRYGDYVGIGPGAHGRLIFDDGQKYATRDHYAPEAWLALVEGQGCGAHPFEALSPDARFLECLMMGLRLPEGIPFARLEAQSGLPWRAGLDDENFERAVEAGWLSYDDERLYSSEEGRLRLNSLIPYILK